MSGCGGENRRPPDGDAAEEHAAAVIVPKVARRTLSFQVVNFPMTS